MKRVGKLLNSITTQFVCARILFSVPLVKYREKTMLLENVFPQEEKIRSRQSAWWIPLFNRDSMGGADVYFHVAIKVLVKTN